MAAFLSCGADVKISGEKAGLHLLCSLSRAKSVSEALRRRGIKLYDCDDYYFTRQEKTHDTLIAGYAGVSLDDIEYLGKTLRAVSR